MRIQIRIDASGNLEYTQFEASPHPPMEPMAYMQGHRTCQLDEAEKLLREIELMLSYINMVTSGVESEPSS